MQTPEYNLPQSFLQMTNKQNKFSHQLIYKEIKPFLPRFLFKKKQQKKQILTDVINFFQSTVLSNQTKSTKTKRSTTWLIIYTNTKYTSVLPQP